MANLVYNIDFEILSIIFTVFMFIEICVCYPNNSEQNRIFRFMTLIVIITELFDLASAFTNSYSQIVPIDINILMNSGYFMSGIFLCYLFYYYIEMGIIHHSKPPKILALNKMFLIISEILVVLNAPFGFFFNFSNNGEYTHGSFYYFLHLASCVFVLCASSRLIRNRKHIDSKKFASSIFFILIYFTAVALQALVFSDVLIIMPAVSCMLVVAAFSLESPDYAKLQKALHELTQAQERLKELNEKNYNLAHTDLMTGIRNRTAYNTDIEKLKMHLDKSELIFLIADVNSLKYLNDNFGHSVGDDAIERTAKVLKSNFTNGCKCYRIGGDEFAVIGYDIKEDDFNQCYCKFLQDVENENANTSYHYSVATAYKVVGDSTISDALKIADKKMYENKSAQKEKVQVEATE